MERLKTPTEAFAGEKPASEFEVGAAEVVPAEDEDVVNIQPKQKKSKRKVCLSSPIPSKKKKAATPRKGKSLHDFFKKQT